MTALPLAERGILRRLLVGPLRRDGVTDCQRETITRLWRDGLVEWDHDTRDGVPVARITDKGRAALPAPQDSTIDVRGGISAP